jgi:hypothetical protein
MEMGLWELPDESVLPPIDWDSNDGATFIVELRKRDEYRVYGYYNQRPPFSQAQEAKRAWEMRLLLERQTLPVANEKLNGRGDR